MAVLTIGSSGGEVTKLQEQLKAAGYDITADGKYGPKTEAAVKDYQQKMGLTVDGKAGNQTKGSLSSYSSTTPATTTTTTTNSGSTSSPSGTGGQSLINGRTPTLSDYMNYAYLDPDEPTNGPGVYGNYEQFGQYAGYYKKAGVDEMTSAADAYSPSYGNANSYLSDVKSSEPTAYSSQYSDQIDAILQSILNTGAFQGENDSNFQSLYAGQESAYKANAQKAMQDAMGQAAALNGGYGSSYATAVGQQAYNDQMNNLSTLRNQLLQIAYSMYQDDMSSKYNQLSALQGLDNSKYSQWQDSYNNWLSKLGYATDQANTAYERKLAETQYADSKAQSDIDYALELASAGVDPSIYKDSIGEDLYNQLKTLAATTAANKAASTKSGGSGSSGKAGNGSSGNSYGTEYDSILKKIKSKYKDGMTDDEINALILSYYNYDNTFTDAGAMQAFYELTGRKAQ